MTLTLPLYSDKKRIRTYLVLALIFAIITPVFAGAGQGESTAVGAGSQLNPTALGDPSLKVDSESGVDSPKPTKPVNKSVQSDILSEQFNKSLTGGEIPSLETLSRFGYDLFNREATFVPNEISPVGDDYLIGPGDKFVVTMWGKIEGRWTVGVNRDGTIVLPKLGTRSVAGLTFGGLKRFLDSEFKEMYSGFELNVTMQSLRTIQIFVVGNAMHPGSYYVSSLSTLVNALFQSGGPSQTGSLRKIEVKRNGKTVVVFDMYTFILKGDKSQDIRLQPDDVIYIPPVGHMVGIVGNVRVPAIYELKEESNVKDVIELACGVDDYAYNGRLRIFRVKDSGIKQAIEMNLSQASDQVVKPGDVLKVYPIVDDSKYVDVFGATQRSGSYGIQKDMTLKDVIQLSGGLKDSAYTKNAELTRVTFTQDGPEISRKHIDLSEALQGNTSSNITLKPYDSLAIRTVPEWSGVSKVVVKGQVRFPGVYTINKGERLSDVLERSGGYTTLAYRRGAVFTRVRERESQQSRVADVLGRLNSEISALKQLISTSKDGSPSAQADLIQKQKTFDSIEKLTPIGRIAIKLNFLKKGDPFTDILLENGDEISIPSNPNTISVVGAVNNPATFIYNPDKSVSDYVNDCGGYTSDGDIDKQFVIKADGTSAQEKTTFFFFKDRIKPEAGDIIVVPSKRPDEPFSLKDTIQVLYQSAATYGILRTIFNGN